MYEKVSPAHPDKMADRIAGALVDMAYRKEEDPRIAVEVLLGHGRCDIMAETSVTLLGDDGMLTGVCDVVHRIAGGDVSVGYREYPQDPHLADNQSGGIRCGDNGIFKGCPVTEEQRRLTETMRAIYAKHPHDGKAVLDKGRITLCQSHVEDYRELLPFLEGYSDYLINPLGPWTGGPDVDTGGDQPEARQRHGGCRHRRRLAWKGPEQGGRDAQHRVPPSGAGGRL